MIKPVEPKKILCIHDLSGVGRCSLAVILPVLSVMGLQPVALPTVVLSTHTGGLGTPARLDGCAYGEAALEHYHALGLDFDCIYTGYLGGEAQVALAEKAFALWPSAHKVVDPVMGDNGKAYATVTPELISRIRQLCRSANLILPNYTEAQLLLQRTPVDDPLDDAAAQVLADELTALAPSAVVTGLPPGLPLVGTQHHQRPPGLQMQGRLHLGPVHRAYAGDQHRAYAVFYVLCQLPHLRQAQQLLHQRLHRAPPFLRSALGGVYDCSIRPEAVTELKSIN